MTTQMKALDEKILMVMFVLVLKRVHFFVAHFLFVWKGNKTTIKQLLSCRIHNSLSIRIFIASWLYWLIDSKCTNLWLIVHSYLHVVHNHLIPGVYLIILNSASKYEKANNKRRSYSNYLIKHFYALGWVSEVFRLFRHLDNYLCWCNLYLT